eukprot:TRINITY_DN5261_c0_g1_i1.p1 TRINITY_DN5261_c0_g1~~TRINITY_DN5261_c0_g1_i1.p1  ORF type:complete len:172 (-),score=37.15 TRINITY_DN5261_c0_g1_i1:80-595(-)
MDDKKNNDQQKDYMKALQHNPWGQYSKVLEWIPADFDPMDSCAFKSAMSGAMGGAMGLVFGIVFSNPDGAMYGAGIVQPEKKMNYKEYFKSLGKTSWWYGKSFAMVGLLFTGSECLVEKARGKKDSYNGILGGCITGSLLATRMGPKFLPGGCVSFGAFSAVMDYFMAREY